MRYRRLQRVILLVAAGMIVTACTFPAWRDQVMADLMAGRLVTDYSRMGTGGSRSQTIEFYDAGGRHVGYAVISGGTANFYAPDGSRVGYGRGWR